VALRLGLRRLEPLIYALGLLGVRVRVRSRAGLRGRVRVRGRARVWVEYVALDQLSG